MGKKNIVLVTITLIICFNGCTQKNYAGPKISISKYSEEVFDVEIPFNLNIEADSSNLQIYSWKHKKIKFEITKKVRGIYKKELLEKELDKYNIQLNISNNTIDINASYKGKLKKPSDYCTDLTVYLPERIEMLYMNIGTGTVKIHDDLECTLKAVLETANIDMNFFKGYLDINGDMGNVNIGGGHLKNGSAIYRNMGNIDIDAVLENNGEYCFETGLGNVTLNLPSDTKMKYINIGEVKNNEFKSFEEYGIISVKSGMGEISILKKIPA